MLQVVQVVQVVRVARVVRVVQVVMGVQGVQVVQLVFCLDRIRKICSLGLCYLDASNINLKSLANVRQLCAELVQLPEVIVC